ncbi:glycerol-3-phosphate 1-O-acyltransferase PlsY [Chloroflexota bacterium]
MIVAKFIVVIAIGYLLGAIPFGLVIARLRRGVDVRQYGSGKTGVANVTRTAGKAAGALVFVLDISKGAATALIAWAIVGPRTSEVHAAMAAASFAAMIGHNWSVYIKFKGGRGVTVGVGGLLGMYWPIGLAGLVVFFLVVVLSKYVSLASMVAASCSIWISIPLVALDILWMEYLIFGIIGTSLIVFRHRDNIKRLLAGTERKAGQRINIDKEGS